MIINVGNTYYTEINSVIRETENEKIILKDVLGQRYIGCGIGGKNIEIHGTPGNALGSYMNGATLTVYGNAQDATGDTMNSGEIIIHGNCGDATGYGMRSGEIYIKGNVGYRAGIHMKEYESYRPTIIVGGESGDFLGEYQAGGIIIVLGLENKSSCPVGRFCGTGMHGGVIYLRASEAPNDLPDQVNISPLDEEDYILLEKYISKFTNLFDTEAIDLSTSSFIKLTPNTKNPYKQLYTHN